MTKLFNPILFIAIMSMMLPSFATDEPIVIDGERAQSYVYVLASDSLEGRRTGLPGGEKAADWIADQFASFGLLPGVGDTSYFQPWTLDAPYEEPPMVLRRLPNAGENDTLEFDYGKDFVLFLHGGGGRHIGQLVFLSYGINAPERGRDDYQGLDLDGKIALALRGAPSPGGRRFWKDESSNGYKAVTAYDAGAVGFLEFQGEEAIKGAMGEENFREDLPTFWISEPALNSILSGTGLDADSLKKLANSNPDGFHLALPITLEIEAHGKVIKDAPTRNVVARIPGSDPVLAHEIVLVGAHMDHLGVDAAGRIYNGAEDNASGTALTLELARTMMERDEHPKRTVCFCTFGAEELGLMGSEAFVENPPIPLDSVVAMINMDMVGEGGEGASIGGGCNFPEAIDIWESALTQEQLDRIFQFKPGYYSDHAPFEDVGIPAFAVFGRGEHKFYHQPEDTAALIHPDVLSEVGGMVYAGIQAFANYPEELFRKDRYQRYLWDASETVLIGSPEFPLEVDGDAPDLFLYDAAGSTTALEEVLCKLDHFESDLLEQPDDKYTRISSLRDIPTGKKIPALCTGLSSPLANSELPELYRTLRRLDVSFVTVPSNQVKNYIKKSGLTAEGLSFLLALHQSGLKSIWEVRNLDQALKLAESSSSPITIHLTSSLKGVDEAAWPAQNTCFFLLDADRVEDLELSQLGKMGEAIGWPKIGVYAETFDEAEDLIDKWLEAGYEQNLINGLLGDHLVYYLKK